MLRRALDVRQQWVHLLCPAACARRGRAPLWQAPRPRLRGHLTYCQPRAHSPHTIPSFAVRHLSAHAEPAAAVHSHSFASTLQLPQSTFPLHFNAAVHEPRLSPLTTTELYRHQQAQPLLQSDLTLSSTPPLFLLHDGPPFANGKLHIGHFLNKTLKDIHNRYQLLRGRRVHYVSGWDCHGLPIELKALAHSADNTDSRSSPLHIRRTARAFAEATIREQRAELQRWGVLTDWDVTYRTMDAEYEAQQLSVLLQLHKRKLLYRAKKPVWWSPATQTALAEAELEYEEQHQSRAVWVLFPVREGAVKEQCGDVSVLIWTTTPWTLPGNVAIAYSPTVDYVVARVGERLESETKPGAREQEAVDDWREGKQLLIARERVEFVSSLLRRQLTVVCSVPTASLASNVTSHPFLPRTSPLLPAAHVTTDTGTAFVHTAPAHGVDDFIACQAAGIATLHDHVDERGRYTAGVGGGLEGQEVLGEGSESVIALLRREERLLHAERYVHRYPYDWRSKTPVITRTTEQWFARLDTLQADALSAIDAVQFTPEAGRGRLAAMVSGRKEWCLSRQRVWGVPIPVFYREDGQVVLDEESVQHVIELVREHGSDCWWEMDERQLMPPRYHDDGHRYTKGQDTMDVWFDSGSSWLPALNRLASSTPSQQPPAAQFDVYLEGSDQHRGWFQSSLLTSVAMRGVAPYKRIVTHGFVLDEAGRKMSKSIGNVIDPDTIIRGLPLPSAAAASAAGAPAQPSKTKQKRASAQQGKARQYSTSGAPTGVDFLRLWVSSIDYTNDASIGATSLSKVGDTYKKVRAMCRWMLGCVDGMGANGGRVGWEQLLGVDRWMVRKCEEFVAGATEAYDSSRYNRVYALLAQLLSVELSAYYSDISKDRLYASGATSIERRQVQTVLCVVLECVMKVVAPLMPHTAEDVYQHMDAAVRRRLVDATGDAEHAPPQLDSAFLHGWCGLASEASGLRRARRGREAEYEAEYERYELVRRLRGEVNRVLEVARHAKKREAADGADGGGVGGGTRVVGEGTLQPVEAEVVLRVARGGRVEEAVRRMAKDELRMVLGVSQVRVEAGEAGTKPSVENDAPTFEVSGSAEVETTGGEAEKVAIRVRRAEGVMKCNRCWRYCASEREDCLCARCVQVLREAGNPLGA